MGIYTSRQSLIAAVDQVDASRRIVNLDESALADMLFGATVGKVLIDALLSGKRPSAHSIYASIDEVTSALFTEGTPQ